MKENVIYFLIAVVLLGAVGYWYYRGRTKIPEVTPEEEMLLFPTEKEVTAGEEEEEVSPVSNLDAIRMALAKKYSKPVDDVEATIEKIDLPHARGTVRLAGEVGGGWWLGYKEKGGWMIVADGNGVIPCEKIKSYEFPKSIVPEC